MDQEQIQPATFKQERHVSGDEVFFGFWSKNAYREHTYAEMFAWKYGRWPTVAEEQAITDEQAKQWFNERYTTTNVFSTEPPKNVKTTTTNVGGACFSYTAWQNPTDAEAFIRFGGEIIFPNGVKCKLDFPEGWSKDAKPGTNPNKIPIRVKRPCSACQ